MREDRSFIEDMLKLGENVLGNVLGARHEVGAQARTKLDGLTRKLDLVTRSEFDAAFAMLSKARMMQEELNDRLQVIESKLGIKQKTATKTKPKAKPSRKK